MLNILQQNFEYFSELFHLKLKMNSQNVSKIAKIKKNSTSPRGIFVKKLLNNIIWVFIKYFFNLVFWHFEFSFMGCTELNWHMSDGHLFRLFNHWLTTGEFGFTDQRSATRAVSSHDLLELVTWEKDIFDFICEQLYWHKDQ